MDAPSAMPRCLFRRARAIEYNHSALATNMPCANRTALGMLADRGTFDHCVDWHQVGAIGAGRAPGSAVGRRRGTFHRAWHISYGILVVAY